MIQMFPVDRGVGIDLHGAELEAEKARSQVADAFLAEQGRAGRNQFHPSRDQRSQWQPNRRGHHNQCAIQNTLPRRRPAVSDMVGDTVKSTDGPAGNLLSTALSSTSV